MPDLQTQINDIVMRLNIIDGNNLPVGQIGAIQTLNNRINGVQSDLQASILLMESLVNTYSTQVNQYINLWKVQFPGS